MLAIVISALVAQSVPSPDASAAPTFEPPTVRRMPADQPSIRRGDVTIRDSGSTNTRGYTIVVHSDFSAEVTDAGRQAYRTAVAAPQAKWLFAKVRAAMPFDSLSPATCMKSASFGTTLRLSYDGATTPDLSCGADPVARELSRIAAVIEKQLR